LGLLQASCNPFKSERTLKGVNLGEISQEVLQKFKNELMNFNISVDTLKYFAEKNKSFGEESVGFTFTDLIALYRDTENGIKGLNTVHESASPDYKVERWQNALKKVMDSPYTSLSEKEKKALKMLTITGWDIIQANSGGHKCITNISGLMYFGKEGVQFLKLFQQEFKKLLEEKISIDKQTR